jgi:predicted O-linked N-acetylglucosamine transferase (SPINDLY family)
VVDPRILHALSQHHAGRIDDALALFRSLLVEHPGDFVVLYSITVLATQKGQPMVALEYADRALQTSEGAENLSLVHFARGTILMGLGLFDEALGAFDRAIELNPKNASASNNKASVLQSLNREPDAVQCLLLAHQHDPSDTQILKNLGLGLTTLKQNAAAVPYFARALALDPHHDLTPGYHFFAKLHACDWSHFEEHRQSISEGIREGRLAVNPLAFLAMSDDPTDHLRCASLFAERRYPRNLTPLWNGVQYRHRRLRVGYLSPDFREHAVGSLMAGIVEKHDSRHVETFAFSLGCDDQSKQRKRFKVAFEHFLDCKDKISSEIASLIRAAEIDVLVDLAGYTAGSKAEILAMRPAPVQVNYLGYAGTMGAGWVDFIIADPVVIPLGSEEFFAEKVLRLPHCYLPIDDSVSPLPDSGSREDHGLPSKGLVFCSFNHDYKINPPIWRIWMGLLRDYPGSILWLVKLNQDSPNNLLRECAALDVDPKRIIFSERVPSLEGHLARYRHVDVYLDTFPYNAHSTATDLARMGVPMVTVPGWSFASRVATGVVRSFAAGMQLAPNEAVSAERSAASDSALATSAKQWSDFIDSRTLETYNNQARVFAEMALASGHLGERKLFGGESRSPLGSLGDLATDGGLSTKESTRGTFSRPEPDVTGYTVRHAQSLESLYREASTASAARQG